MGDPGVSDLKSRCIKFTLSLLLLSAPSAAFADSGRLISAAEARDFNPHAATFALPAIRNLIAIAEDSSAWLPTPEAERNRLVALGLAKIQLNLLSDLERRSAEIERGEEHFDYEFVILTSLADIAGRETAGKTSLISERQRLAWFTSSVILDYSLDGIRSIIRLYSIPQDDVELNPDLAKTLEASIDSAADSYREGESYMDDASNFIAGNEIENLRLIGVNATSLSAGKLEDSLERVRQVSQGGQVQSAEVRRATAVAASYGAIAQPVMVVLIPALKVPFDQVLIRAEDALLSIAGKLENFAISGVLTETECDNQKDDDADSAIDCDDNDCGEALVCCRNCI